MPCPAACSGPSGRGTRDLVRAPRRVRRRRPQERRRRSSAASTRAGRSRSVTSPKSSTSRTSTGSSWTCSPPGSALPRVAAALAPGGLVCAYVATTTQLSRFTETVRAQGGFTEPEAWESMVRGWHVEGLAVRPQHKMNGHTGFLVTARRLAPGVSAPRGAAGDRRQAPTGLTTSGHVRPSSCYRRPPKVSKTPRTSDGLRPVRISAR